MKKSEYENQCNDIGLPCPEGYTCYCKPCIKAFEVDVVQRTDTDEDREGEESFGQHKGCGKMAMCGSVEQTRTGVFRAYDNREREEVTLSAIMHVGQETYELPVTQVENETFVYEITYSDDQVGVGILEVYVDGVQIPESPFRIQVVERNCEIDFPGKGKVPVRNTTSSLPRFDVCCCHKLTISYSFLQSRLILVHVYAVPVHMR